ncbi:hypothetical protein [Yonghaparkia sp. Root332]|uniref:hypothetical protein n=1 Tax=Yonghaparkia sp. Root332 TaxID=1736516 RepID=UPI00070220E4|nr:hypothetical protein [Yonghaparkia sp. Root332]KQV25597.1 hypothetical protein ASC54_00915 [Yonghaparkia sp. Root332]
MPRLPLLVPVSLAAVAGVLAGCAPALSEGESRALTLAERVAIGMADDVTRSRVVVGLPIEQLAAEMLTDPRLPDDPGVRPDSFTIDVLDWGGITSWTDPGFIDLRIRADVDAGQGEASGFIPAQTFPAGEATACFRVLIPVAGDDLSAGVSREECVAGAVARAPAGAETFALPPEARERVSALLLSDAPLSEAWTLFDAPVTVDARVIEGRRVIAARGSDVEDCIVLALVDGVVTEIPLTREQRMPGEIGCVADAVRLLD